MRNTAPGFLSKFPCEKGKNKIMSSEYEQGTNRFFDFSTSIGVKRTEVSGSEALGMLVAPYSVDSYGRIVLKYYGSRSASIILSFEYAAFCQWEYLSTQDSIQLS